MSEFRESYVLYDRLPTKSCIRLLRRVRVNESELSINTNTDLHFNLEVVDLNDNPIFEALSYTWGHPVLSLDQLEDTGTSSYGPNDREMIVVNGNPILVHRNLFEALHQLFVLTEIHGDPDERLQPYGKSPLVVAAELGSFAEVSRWLARGSNIHLQDVFGETALHYAAENGHGGIVRLLLQAGADATLLDKSGRTPLECCIQRKRRQHVVAAKLLTEAMKAPLVSFASKVKHMAESLPIWVDYVSINQTDMFERNAQVAQMTRIYQQAVKVVVWLGKQDLPGAAVREISPLDDTASADFQKKMHRLYTLNWFKRSGTVQEVAVAREVSMWYGNLEITFQAGPLMTMILQARDRWEKNKQLPEATGLRLFLRNRMLAVKDPLIQGCFDVQLIEEQLLERYSWSTILAHTWNLEASDPRDKIFAFFGLVNLSDSQIVVDYSCSVAELYLQAGREFIIGDGRRPQSKTTVKLPRVVLNLFLNQLHPLDGLGYNQRSMYRENALDLSLPSWCPIFNLKTSAGPVNYSTFSTCSGKDLAFHLSDPYSLKLDACIFDHVVQIEDEVQQDTQDQVLVWLQMLTDLPEVYLSTYESRSVALLRTLLMHDCKPEFVTDSKVFQGKDDEYKLLQWMNCKLQMSLNSSGSTNTQRPATAVHLPLDLLSYLASAPREEQAMTDDPAKFAETHESAHVAKWRGRSLFCTKRGYLGLGLRSVREGDVVALLAGAHVPYILRPHESNDQHRHNFTYVGDAYVRGIMHGEALTMDELRFETIMIC